MTETGAGAGAEPDDTKMNSLDKMLSILNGFDEATLSLDVARAAELCGSSRASTYRYLQALTRAGLLTPASGGSYIIGSRVIELEMLKRENDPLFGSARHLIRLHAEELGLNVMLCSYYGDKVLCTDIAGSDPAMARLYRPGRSMPIFRGAMAKVILANLSPAQLRNIYASNEAQIAKAGLGETLETFTQTLAEVRVAGYCITHAEVFDGLVGVAAPVHDSEGRILGSVVFVIASDQFEQLETDTLVEQIRDIAAEIEHGIVRRLRRLHKTPVVTAARPRRSVVYRT